MVSKDNNSIRPIYDFLLTADFSEENKYQYWELLNFLKNFQYYYKECYVLMDNNRKELLHKNKSFEESEKRYLEITNLLKEKSDENSMLYQKMNRRLTFWERLTGKIKIKF